MKLNFNEYKDKVYACWLGKNMGGTIGAPYEGKREVLDIKGFATKKGEVLPNDDLDLQLVWLHAVEFEGPRNITAEVLGEYWLSFITGYWNEYGIARINMGKGVMPPLCGDLQNPWKHSNGAWIRTEIWATLAPAYPDLAVRYAIEDAKVDHGFGEGTYSAAFVAALESAAFAVSDLKKLIEIGLAKIPADCRTAKTIKFVLESYDKGVDPIATRNAVQKMNADIGDGWFQAPSNVGYVAIGLLYGEGGFKKSVLTALNCGDDTDCTAGTVGAIFGLIYGTAGIPKDWREYIGDDIVTGTINACVSFPRVKTCTELTEKVASLAPSVLRFNRMNAVTVEFGDVSDFNRSEIDKFVLPYGKCEETDPMRASLFTLKENTLQKKVGCVTAIIACKEGFTVEQGQEKTLAIRVLNNVKAYGNLPRTVRIKLWLPEGFTADKTEFDIFAPNWTPFTLDCISEIKEVKLKAEANLKAVNEILVEVSVSGTYAREFISLPFVAE